MKTSRMNNCEETEANGKKESIQKLIDLKFLEQRKIFLWGQVDDESAEDIVSKLLYLESVRSGRKNYVFYQ